MTGFNGWTPIAALGGIAAAFAITVMLAVASSGSAARVSFLITVAPGCIVLGVLGLRQLRPAPGSAESAGFNTKIFLIAMAITGTIAHVVLA